MLRLRRCAACRRWMLVSRDLVWAHRAIGWAVVCKPGRGCQRRTERIETEGERL